MARRRHVADPHVAVAYLRVSTDEQHLGPEAQRSAIETWATREGLAVVAWHTDQGVSGGAKLDRRPGLLAALDDMKAHAAGVLVVAKRDRLARDVVIAATVERLLQREGARVCSADGVGAGEGPEAALMKKLIDAFSAYERALIGARTRAALQAKARRGERVGELAFGLRLVPEDSARVEPDAHEAAVVDLVLAERQAGRAVAQIVESLTTTGLAPRGKAWHPTTIRRILARHEARRAG